VHPARCIDYIDRADGTAVAPRLGDLRRPTGHRTQWRKTTAEVGGDLAKASKGAVEGAIMGARDVGLTAEAAAAAAATGALQGAGEVSTKAVEQVRDAVTGVVAGVKVVVKEPFRREERRAG
jgi:hypothetical protein